MCLIGLLQKTKEHTHEEFRIVSGLSQVLIGVSLQSLNGIEEKKKTAYVVLGNL